MLLRSEYHRELPEFTAISAANCGHSRALAAAARHLGCKCVLVLLLSTSTDCEAAVSAFRVEVIRNINNGHEALEHATKLTSQRLESDVRVSPEGYQIILRDIMRGYGINAAQIVEAGEQREDFVHMILPGGIGVLADVIASYFTSPRATSPPTFLIIEPAHADYLYQSAMQVWLIVRFVPGFGVFKPCRGFIHDYF
ncbi:pyridoxal-phosphate dependent enzyme [Pseudomonas sp. Marseille-QA0332]